MHSQMHAKEVGKARSDCLMGDGMLVALTGDEFFDRVVEKTQQKEQEQLRKARAHEEDTEYKAKLAEWQAQDHQRVELNKARWVAHKLATNEWNEAKKAAKKAKDFEIRKLVKRLKGLQYVLSELHAR